MARDFATAVEELLTQMSARELARRLHAAHPRQSTENWRRTIGKYKRREITPTEETIQTFARAAEKPRSWFPPVERPPTLKEIAERLAKLEQIVSGLMPLVR